MMPRAMMRALCETLALIDTCTKSAYPHMEQDMHAAMHVPRLSRDHPSTCGGACPAWSAAVTTPSHSRSHCAVGVVTLGRGE
jgi:hypothetical protein